MKFLHILKEMDSREALAFIRGGGSLSPEEIGVVLIQGARGLSPDSMAQVFVLRQSKSAKPAENTHHPEQKPEDRPKHQMVDYGEFLDLIFESEKVVVW